MNALPAIWITVKHCDPLKLLQFAAQLASDGQRYNDVQAEYDFLQTGSHIINIEPTCQYGHQGLYGQLILHPDSNGRIDVELRALHWKNEWPSRSEYTNQARLLFAPILRSFNAINGSRLRLFVRRPATSRPVILAPGLRRMFERFAVLANVNILHPLDWKRFYQFIRYCNSRRATLSDWQLEILLLERGFSEEKSRELAHIYKHGRNILRKRDKQA